MLIVMIYQIKIKTVLLPDLGDFINNINSDNSSNIQLGPLTSLVHCLTTLQPINPALSLIWSKSIGFSDHDLVFGICKISGSMRKEPKIVNCRNTKHYTPEIFMKALSAVSWEHILTAMDPNTMSELWLDQLTDILDQSAPFKPRKVKNSYAPYIDKDLRQTMLLRDFYKKKHAKFKDSSDWSAYKKLRNEANSKKKFKRKSHFSQKLEESRGNIKDTWKILNIAMGRK